MTFIASQRADRSPTRFNRSRSIVAAAISLAALALAPGCTSVAVNAPDADTNADGARADSGTDTRAADTAHADAVGADDGARLPDATPAPPDAGCGNTTDDPLNCGRCGFSCGVGGTCVAGSCQCDPAGTLCRGRCTSLASDPNDCGACGQRCPSGGVCTAGVCECPDGTAACSLADTVAGCTTDPTFQTDARNCGACGHGCETSFLCIAGTCVVDPDSVWDIVVNSVTVPMTDPDGHPWRADGTPPNLMVEVDVGGDVSTVNSCWGGIMAPTPTQTSAFRADWNLVTVAAVRAREISTCLGFWIRDDVAPSPQPMFRTWGPVSPIPFNGLNTPINFYYGAAGPTLLVSILPH